MRLSSDKIKLRQCTIRNILCMLDCKFGETSLYCHRINLNTNCQNCILNNIEYIKQMYSKI